MTQTLSLSISKFFKNSGITWPGWCTIFIWKAGVLILFGLTIKDFLPLLDEYTKNNVATQIQVVGYNESVKPPKVSILIGGDAKQLQRIVAYLLDDNETALCVECDKLTNKSWDLWNDLDLSMSLDAVEADYGWNISAAFVKQLLETDYETNFSTLSLNNFDWNQPIIEAVWNFFACMRFQDQLGEGYVDPMKGDLNWCYRDQLADIFLSDKKMIDILFARLSDLLSTFIIHKYSDQSDKQWILDQAMVLDTNVFASTNRVRPIIYYTGFCYPIKILEKNSIEVIINSSSQHHGVWELITDPFNILVTNPALISWPIGFYINSDLVYQSEDISDAIEVSYAVSLHVTESRDGVYCHEEESTYECLGNCVVRKMFDLCDCIPFTFRDMFTDFEATPYCNTSNYANCPMNNSQEIQKCDEKCRNPCTYTSYQWHITKEGDPDGKIRQFSFMLHPLSPPYVEFTVTTKNTPEQFLSQIGAIINLYLGFSGLSLIALVIYSTNFFKRWYYSKKSKFDQPNDNLVFRGRRSIREQNEGFENIPPPFAAFGNVSKDQYATKEDIYNLRQELKKDIAEIKKFILKDNVRLGRNLTIKRKE